MNGPNTTNGLCECGCGQPAPIAKRNTREGNHVKGQPIRFISGHNVYTEEFKATCKSGPEHSKWKGGRIVTSQGNIKLWMPNHPRAVHNYVYEHIYLAEQSMGFYLPSNAVIRHVDGNNANNELSNLVVCENNAYHRMLHRRTRAYKGCGHAHWRKCNYCKNWDDPVNLVLSSNSSVYHRKCATQYSKDHICH